MTKKPLIALAVVAGAAVPAGAFVAADATAQSAKPRVSDLNADLLRGDRLRLTVDATRASTVTIRYNGQTKRARITDRDDDGSNEYGATFTAASGDRRDNVRVSARITAKRGSATTTRTLSDRVDDERRDDDDNDD